jgi:hypothetical protein
MKNMLRLVLEASPEQESRLRSLQAAFAQVCNALAPTVQQTRCWHRVTLHHLTYKKLRERFPSVGSQMVCNAIYSVCRTGRAVYQHPASPYNVAKLGQRPLPLLRFAENSPVYFDRHTISLKGDQLSLYTLDGRTHFRVPTEALAKARFGERRLLEAVLARNPKSGRFELNFLFADQADDDKASRRAGAAGAPIPDYVQVQAAQ